MRFDYRTHTTQASILEAATTYFDQGLGQCLNSDQQCAYRGTNGHTCVAGAFIPDEIYARIGEGAISMYAWHCNPDSEEFRAWLKTHYKLMCGLQLIHDNPLNWEDQVLSETGRRALEELKASFAG